MVTQEKIKAALEVVRAVADTIREVGSAPAGIIYTAMMGRGFTYSDFEAVIGILERGKLVDRRGDLLVWIG